MKSRDHVILPVDLKNMSVPYTVYLWIPGRDENGDDEHEYPLTMERYKTIEALVRRDSPVRTSFHIVENLAQLVSHLKPIEGYLPVFMFVGHGDPNNGSMRMWNGEALNPTTLRTAWKREDQFECDIIAAGCGANSFCSHAKYPILHYYDRRCRFIAAAEPLARYSYSYEGCLVELMQLFVHYLRAHANGGKQTEVKKLLNLVDEYNLYVTQQAEDAERARQDRLTQERRDLEQAVETRLRAEINQEVTKKRAAELVKWRYYCQCCVFWLALFVQFVLCCSSSGGSCNFASLVVCISINFLSYRVLVRK
jgi:hypothetical protein